MPPLHGKGLGAASPSMGLWGSFTIRPTFSLFVFKSPIHHTNRLLYLRGVHAVSMKPQGIAVDLGVAGRRG